MLKYIILLGVLITLVSCSFKSDKDGDGSGGAVDRSEELSVDMKKLDSDGDMINDYDEKVKGLDRFVADIPKIKVHFLQDYKITVQYEDESQYFINTEVRRDNPDFKYRVGSIFLKENSYKNASRVGRFSGVSWGNIKQEDLSWVKYPEIDKSFYHAKVLEFDSNKNKKQVGTTINLENSLKLESKSPYSQIEQLEVNFYYYSHEKEKYVQVHTQKIDKVFQAGIRENFHVTIENPPKELLEDSYLRRGEFIISEVKDFYIPELKTSYKKLLKSIKAKSLPVYIATPFESSVKYVGLNKDDSFIEVLKKLYSDKFKIQTEKLTQIEQFSNNLRGFTYLNELSGIDKEGKWFVMTNKLKNHYLKHKYTVNDSISLTYITGDELSKTKEETVFSKKEDLDTKDKTIKYVLGNVTNNTTIEVSIYRDWIRGYRLDKKPGTAAFSPPRCRNCSGTNWGIRINYSVNEFILFQNDRFFESINEFIAGYEVKVNNTSLDLNKLVEENHAELEFVEDDFRPFVRLKVKNLDKLKVIESGQENIAFLIVKPLSKGSEGVGIKLDSASGKNVDVIFHGGLMTMKEAGRLRLPIAVDGWNFDKWGNNVPWGQRMNDGFVPKKGAIKSHYEGQIVDIISTVTNFIN